MQSRAAASGAVRKRPNSSDDESRDRSETKFGFTDHIGVCRGAGQKT